MAKDKEPREEVREEAEVRDKEEIECPFCWCLRTMAARKKRHPEFFEHLKAAEKEMLKAVRSLIDERLEAEEQGRKGRKATRIKVE